MPTVELSAFVVRIMKRTVRNISIALALLIVGGAVALAKMTDQQVISYVKMATAQGKSQQQIGKELFSRGVSQEQLERVKKTIEKQGPDAGAKSAKRKVDANGSATSRVVDKAASDSTATKPISEDVAALKARAEREGYYVRDANGAIVFMPGTESTVPVDSATYNSLLSIEPIPQVFGQDIFRGRNLTFEPNVNMATPEDYRLGPGDEVVINIWGNNENNIRETITPEGNIIVSQVGPVYLSGLTVKEANNRVKSALSSIYADIEAEASDISLTLGQLRSIQVNVMGEVMTPGTYRMSPFSTLFSAVYNAGGVAPSGSLRSIEVMRNGRRIASADLYEFLFNGKSDGDIRLQENDVVIVSPYDRIVRVDGSVKRPMSYEMKKGETLSDLIEYAGGMTGNAYGDRLTLERSTGKGKSVVTVEAADFETTRLDDGDVVVVPEGISRYDNRVDVAGAVFRPGKYAIGTDVVTVKDLIEKADGLREDAFTNRVQLYRENDDRTVAVEALNLGAILDGTSQDVTLKPNDVLIVSSVQDLEPKGAFRILGEVAKPGSYAYAEGTTVEDLIMLAGGMLEGASDAKVDVSRRVVDPSATDIDGKIAQNFSITISKGLVLDGGDKFILEPNDIVDVRHSPAYVPQRRVRVSGEVPFEGLYTLSNRSERLSDLVKRAGGISDFAYIKGAHLTRKLTTEEKIARDESLRLALSSAGADSISTANLLTSDSYPIGINLDKALSNPGSAEDLVLQDGDELVIPELVNTVKITGDVLYPNSVVYMPNKKLKYYIEQAGGFGDHANKGKAFVVYMNGHVERGKNAVIEPGCQIIVPTKPQKDNANNIQKWLSIGTSAASLGTMAASIINLIK